MILVAMVVVDCRLLKIIINPNNSPEDWSDLISTTIHIYTSNISNGHLCLRLYLEISYLIYCVATSFKIILWSNKTNMFYILRNMKKLFSSFRACFICQNLVEPDGMEFKIPFDHMAYHLWFKIVKELSYVGFFNISLQGIWHSINYNSTDISTNQT